MNYTYIIIATLAQFVFGALWYSPILFGKKWMRIMGANHKTVEELKREEKKMGPAYVAQIFLTLVSTFALDIMIIVLPFSAVTTTLFLLIGFILPIQISGVIWGATENKYKLEQIVIVVSGQLISMLIAALILTL